MHVLHIETSGNQSFIFATNKLRENVGASELVWRIGAFATDAVEQAAAGGALCRTILATSGKATVVTGDRATAEGIVRTVSRRALEEAPGVDVHGAIGDFDPEAEPLDRALARVRERHESLRLVIPASARRFQRLPCVADCATSGLPATPSRKGFHGIRSEDRTSDIRSAVSQAKWIAAREGIERMARSAANTPVMTSVADLDRMESDDLDWLAVVHADGNGLGQMLRGFHDLAERHLPGGGWEAHADLLNRFSTELDAATQRAFGHAAGVAWQLWRTRAAGRQGDRLPLVPLVLGGDDLTVVCAGRIALRFTTEFLQAFERETAAGLVGDLAALREGMPHRELSACAGVAIIKPHFPFHAAYELAEDLIASAKQVKQRFSALPCSAFDFHVLYDSSDASLERIRGAWRLDDGKTSLTSRPYVVSSGAAADAWAAPRHVHRLDAMMRAMLARDDGRRVLPNSMLHEIRESLFLGRKAAEKRLQLVIGRHAAEKFGPLLTEKQLFREELGSDGATVHHANLLDALELDGFWQPVGDDHAGGDR